jgi:DNA polymerase I-like protein with 3'-5' exonuclease and polymerase domains
MAASVSPPPGPPSGPFLFCIDLETFLIEQGGGAPPPVCAGWTAYDAGVVQNGVVHVNGDAEGDWTPTAGAPSALAQLYRWGIERVRVEAAKGRVARFINQNIPFDLGVVCAAYPELIPLVFEAYDEGIVEDTMIREQLIDIAAGSLGWVRGVMSPRGTRVKRAYTLKDMAKRRLGIDMDKTTWRLGYADLVDVPLAKWPQGAKDYAIDDTGIAIDVYLSQRAELTEDVDTGEVPNSIEQARAHWALHLMSTWGIRTDGARVARYKHELELRLRVLSDALSAVGFIRGSGIKGKKEGTKDKKLIEDTIVELHASDRWPAGHELARTEKGAVSMTAQAMDDLLEALDLNLVPMKALDVDDGRGGRRKKEPVEFALDLARTLPTIPGDTVTDLDGHPVPKKIAALALLAWHTSTQKLLGTYVPWLDAGAKYPINCRYQPLVESGRTSCTSPNLQNLPKERGVRECYRARPGMVLSSVDYEALELHTLAQACLTLLGKSKLAEALNDGVDPHLLLATEFLLDGIAYDEGKKIRKDEKHPRHKEVVHARNVAKCFHPDTEFLTKEGWKKFHDLGELEVAQATPTVAGGLEISWALPTGKFTKPATKLVHLYSEGIDLRVTEDHRMLTFNKNGDPLVVTPNEFSKKRGFWNAGTLRGGTRTVGSEALLRLAVATQADGSYAGRKKSIRFGFSKERKKERLLELLYACEKEGFDFHADRRSYNTEKMPNCDFWEIHGPLVTEVKACLDEKKLPAWWLDLPEEEREIILDEARYWDSHSPPRGVAYTFTSTQQQNVDVLQRLATITGRKTRLVKEKNKEHWKLTIREKADSRGGNIQTTVEDYDGEVVCFSVPSTFVVVRSGGVPVVTGQCANFGLPGALSAKTLVAYAKASGILLDLETATTLKAKWFKAWPEMKDYFKKISASLYLDDDGEQVATVEQLYSARIRGGARYTAACNSLFQGLAADLAKAACYELAKACYVPGHNAILYGSRPVVFIHDETICEHPVETAHERAMEQARIMVEAGRSFCPDVPLKAEPALMFHWSKDAVAVYDESKRLMPWLPQGEK